MRSLCGGLVILFFLGSVISGLLSLKNGRPFILKIFWISIPVFLASSSVLLLFFDPFWVAIAPAIPALILIWIIRCAKPNVSDSDEDADE